MLVLTGRRPVTGTMGAAHNLDPEMPHYTGPSRPGRARPAAQWTNQQDAHQQKATVIKPRFTKKVS
jgi:hypothetical protein